MKDVGCRIGRICGTQSGELIWSGKESPLAKSSFLFVQFRWVPQVLSTQLQARCDVYVSVCGPINHTSVSMLSVVSSGNPHKLTPWSVTLSEIAKD